MQFAPSFRRRFIGDKAFYKMVFAIALPIIVQNTVSNFVNLLDNIMIGAIGTEPMSGVSIANQILMIFFAGVFGCNAGAGIFSAQFAGAQDHEGVRHTLRFKLYGALIICTLGILIYSLFGRTLIGLYLTEDASGDTAATLEYGWAYLKIILISLVPMAISQVYASTLCETGETALPMKATIAEVFTNAILNYLLIFGKLGLPAMGVVGAALATLISRLVGLAILLLYTHTHGKKHPFIVGAYSSPRIPKALTKDILRKGMLLLVNEELWALGMTILMQQYSMRGLMVVAASNICGTISNMFAMF
ncbi:MAG: MATE family efflux transporter, partial [Eubacteriales bacterium]|nr:MATE family efflux transporter [Eubacteriales bacterium]